MMLQLIAKNTKIIKAEKRTLNIFPHIPIS